MYWRLYRDWWGWVMYANEWRSILVWSDLYCTLLLTSYRISVCYILYISLLSYMLCVMSYLLYALLVYSYHTMAGRTPELLPTDCGCQCFDRYHLPVLIGVGLSELAGMTFVSHIDWSPRLLLFWDRPRHTLYLYFQFAGYFIPETCIF